MLGIFYSARRAHGLLVLIIVLIGEWCRKFLKRRANTAQTKDFIDIQKEFSILLDIVDAPNNAKSVVRFKQAELRKQLWPDVADEDLWQRKKSNGFTTLPRTMPLLLAFMDSLAKGRPTSTTYLDLWCRSYDECFVVLNKPREMAFSAGFTGQRAEQTWQGRIKILVELDFVKVKPGPSGPMSYALLPNPYKVAKRLRTNNPEGFPEDIFYALIARSLEIGADDLSEMPPLNAQRAPAPQFAHLTGAGREK